MRPPASNGKNNYDTTPPPKSVAFWTRRSELNGKVARPPSPALRRARASVRPVSGNSRSSPVPKLLGAVASRCLPVADPRLGGPGVPIDPRYLADCRRWSVTGQVPRKAVSFQTENSAPPQIVCRAFFRAISAYMLINPPPQVTSIQRRKGRSVFVA